MQKNKYFAHLLDPQNTFFTPSYATKSTPPKLLEYMNFVAITFCSTMSQAILGIGLHTFFKKRNERKEKILANTTPPPSLWAHDSDAQ